MSLLPIIYTSLMIFTAVMTVVLIISYLSYKAKQRNSAPDNSIYEESMNYNQQAAINRTAVYSSPAVYATPAPVYATPAPVYAQPTRTAYAEQRRPSASTYTSERTSQRQVTRETTTKKRFHVVNNNSRNEFMTNLQPASMGGFSRTPAPEFNFLNYYSDQKDDKLSSISMDRYKNYR
jgi:hypothetical protein